MSERRAYELTITLRSPFMFQGVVNTRTGVDVALLRDQLGAVIIPGTQVRGVLHAALNTLAKATGGSIINPDEIAALFGVSSDDAPESDQPQRGLAIFDDLAGPSASGKLQTTRIKIDEATGTVDKGSLQVIELAALPGAECIFSGQLIIRHGTGFNGVALDMARIGNALKKALALVPSIGAYKSAGFGEVIQEKTRITEDASGRRTLTIAASAKPGSSTAERQTFDMSFDRPIMVDTLRADANNFESASIIPGGTIKGALATRLALGGMDPQHPGALADAFAALRVSHAFPVDPASGALADLPLPLSLLIVGKGTDDTRYAHAVPGHGHAMLHRNRPAEFVANGKEMDQSAAREALALPAFCPVKLPRVHVQIDEERIAAVTSRLYTTVLVGHLGLDKKPLRWRFSVDTGGVADPALRALFTDLLAEPLDGVGRNGSTASMTAVGPTPALPALAVGETVDLWLLTPAMLSEPKDGVALGPIDAGHASYFDRYLANTEMVACLAKRTMAGGYQPNRFRAYGANTYFPFIITRPGAVFRIRIVSEASRDAVLSALRFGLPCADINGGPPNWRISPYLHENGYGAVRLLDQTIIPARLAFEPEMAGGIVVR
jgi:hypothetical protein